MTAARFRRAAFLFEFLPLSVFAVYAFWNGEPGLDRFAQAFLLGGSVALVQLGLTLPGGRPVNRLILGADLYLIVGAVAVLTTSVAVFRVYDVLKEAAIFAGMLLVGAVTTVWSKSGYVGVPHPDRRRVRRASLGLLAFTLGAFAMSVGFSGSTTWAAVVPVVALTLTKRALARRLSRPDGAPGQSARPSSPATAATSSSGSIGLTR